MQKYFDPKISSNSFCVEIDSCEQSRTIPWERSRGHISCSIDLKIGQNVCLSEILDEFKFGSCREKTRSLGQMQKYFDQKISSNSFCVEIDSGEQSRAIMAHLLAHLSKTCLRGACVVAQCLSSVMHHKHLLYGHPGGHISCSFDLNEFSQNVFLIRSRTSSNLGHLGS